MMCPFCKSENVEVPYVDIGVGYQQCGPAFCYDCNAHQACPDDTMSSALKEEKDVGWYRGPTYKDEPAPARIQAVEIQRVCLACHQSLTGRCGAHGQ